MEELVSDPCRPGPKKPRSEMEDIMHRRFPSPKMSRFATSKRYDEAWQSYYCKSIFPTDPDDPWPGAAWFKSSMAVIMDEDEYRSKLASITDKSERRYFIKLRRDGRT